MMRHSSNVTNSNLHFKEMPIDVKIRDKFIKQMGSVLNLDKMQFWSFPETFIHILLGVLY